MFHYRTAVPIAALLVLSHCCHAEDSNSPTEHGDRLAAEYFALETAKLSEATFAEIETLEDWERLRDGYRDELHEMLGLDPMPERTDLHPVVTGTLETDEFVVEKLQFQSMPGLYVTGNLYRPRQVDGALPAVLYVCGHGRQEVDGVSVGNKTHYQHHGEWFARNGYVCLTIDTIQLGEIEGMHHGTYRHDKWWWNNRGYTPAGVEAWNSIRAVDYLQSRGEVDPGRIGVTGRSGGGAYSWWLAALDERIQAAVPVAGITTLQNHVVDGCVEGHCDCMFMVNTYRWDYPMVAALVAPRPLLISNSDKDPIFPLDGVVELHRKVRRIYELYDAESKLGLQITEGPHQDTQELRVHAFRWFNRFLKNDRSLIETVATPYFETGELKVFDELPVDERVTEIHESFVPKVTAEELPQSHSDLKKQSKHWKEALLQKSFRGWPSSTSEALDSKVVAQSQQDGCLVRAIEYTSQSPYRLTMFVVEPSPSESGDDESTSAAEAVDVRILDQQGWDDMAPAWSYLFPEIVVGVKSDAELWQSTSESLSGSATVFVAPRGVGLTQWSTDKKTRTHLRRRFMLLGQTAASMQIYDVRRGLQAIDAIDGVGGTRNLIGRGDAAVWALYASLFEDRIAELELTDLPARNRDAPDLLNVSRSVELPHVVSMAADRASGVILRAADDDIAQWQSVDFPDLGGKIRLIKK
ncbi:alpha/beta hydrolase family protein [Allorhodopirellula solitaria]|uniref:Alpha/beta hydrolase family protein n=1 Tax=Allorhodopirellula solitaria TaxID=2527987 RepID=A0A5C5YHP1_9BACT|nr:acetylxylan esterase [Allorhodopirellula solitaria]TWT73102.1 Alpha/beta hydrolase family protein [Allorhodopirellula solitaria]